MAADPWAVVSTQPADPWAVQSQTPVAAPKAAAPAQPKAPGLDAPNGNPVHDFFNNGADDPLHHAYAWVKQFNAGQPQATTPRVPDMPNPMGDVADQIVHAAKSLGPWQPFGAPSAHDNPVEAAAKFALHALDSQIAPVRAAGAVGNAAIQGAQSSLVNKPLSQATGLPQSDIDTAMLALAPGKGHAPAAPVEEAAAAPAAPKPADVPPEVPVAARAADWNVVKQEPAAAPPRAPSPKTLAETYDATTAAAPKPWSVVKEEPAAGAPPPEEPATAAGAAPPGEPPPSIPGEPGPVLEPQPKGEADPLGGQMTRTEDALNRLVKNADADKIEAKQYLESQPPEITDPAIQEKLYHDVEGRMINPAAPLSPEVQAAHDALKPWKDEEAQLGQKLAGMGYGEEHSIDPSAYVHRVAQGKGSFMDAALDPTERAGRDPVMGDRQGPGTRGLSRSTSSQQARKFFVLEDAKGNRQFVTDPDAAAKLQSGVPIMNPTTLEAVTPKPATTAEIEANTGYRYHKNALVNTVDNVLRLRRAARNADVLEGLKQQLGKNGLIHYDQTPGQPPEGFVRLTIPQFKGAFADPRIAHILNDFHGELARGGEINQMLAKVNRLLTGAIFITPIPHAWNVANHWTVARGFDWLKPGGYKSLMLDGGRAVRAVLTQNEDYQRMLREGSGLMYGGVANRDFHTVMIKKLGGEILADPKGWAPVAKMFGFANPAALVKTIYRLSSKALWSVNDMFMLQRQFELMRKGLPVREAIHEAERDIPNYRVPSHIGGKNPANRALAELMKNPNVLMFGRYRYGQFRAYAEPIKDIFNSKLSASQKAEASGKLFVMAAMAMGVYPILDKVVQKLSGNKDASVHRGGGLSIPSAVADKVSGKKSWGQMTSSIAQPSPVVEIGTELLHGKDGLGRNIIEPQSSLKGKAAQAAEYAASKVAPLNTAMQMTRPGGVPQALGNLAAISLPRQQTAVNRAKSVRYDMRRAARREARDPLMGGH